MIDAGTYELLSRLSLATKQKSTENKAGNRRSAKKGTSAEFSDFREYLPGDDLRRLDWNVYARSRRMVIREYMEEKEAVVTVLLDTSASMDYGEHSKFALARDLAAAVSYLALAHMDRLVLYDAGMMRSLALSGGKNAFPRVLGWLDARRAGKTLALLDTVKKLPLSGAGVTVVISDFLAPELLDEESRALEKTMQYLSYRRQRPVLLQTLCGEELRIAMDGTRNLIDMETDERLRVTMNAAAITRYEKELRALGKRLKDAARACQGAYVLCDSEKELRQLIMEDLREIYDS